MAKFKRILHPVGHGAFFSEHFFDDQGNQLFNVVYDCGTLSGTTTCPNRTILQRQIDATFTQDDHIGILFISHFDSDHINGIEELITRGYVNDKTLVFIPIKYYQIVQFAAQVNPIYFEINHLIGELLRNNIHIIGVDNNYAREQERAEPMNLEMLRGRDYVPNGTTFSAFPGWYYVLYISPHKSNYLQRFEDNLRQAGYTENQLRNTHNLLQQEEDLDNIRQAANDAGRGNAINMHSLQVLSFPACDKSNGQITYNRSHAENIVVQRLKHLNNIRKKLTSKKYPTNINNASCLYTGDNKLSSYETYNSEIHFMLSTLAAHHHPETIGLMQIPHHGSKYNYPSLLPFEKLVEMSFVNCGYFHGRFIFDESIYLSYHSANTPLFFITDDSQTEFQQEIIY